MLNSKYITIAVVVVIIIILLLVFRKHIQAVYLKLTTPRETITPPAGAQLDYNQLLMQGITGPEVKQLQVWLGVTQDGIFGPETEGALYNRKGVTQTTLNAFQSLADQQQPDEGYNVSDDDDNNIEDLSSAGNSNANFPWIGDANILQNGVNSSLVWNN